MLVGVQRSLVTHIARVWIKRVRLPVLLVVSSTGKMNISPSAFVPGNLVSRDGFGSPVPRQPAHLYTKAGSGAYLRDSSRVPRRRPFIHLKPPYAIGSVPSLSGHSFAYLWRSLPRARRLRASKPQGCSERVLPWQVIPPRRAGLPLRAEGSAFGDYGDYPGGACSKPRIEKLLLYNVCF